jgi:hypothetical protein
MDDIVAALLCLPFIITPLILLVVIVLNRIPSCHSRR